MVKSFNHVGKLDSASHDEDCFIERQLQDVVTLKMFSMDWYNKSLM